MESSNDDRINFAFGGVPLGGLGTGTVELREDGRFHEWQIFNNWGNCFKLPPITFGNHAASFNLESALLAVRVKGKSGNISTKILEPHQRFELSPIQNIEYNGKFPLVELNYQPELSHQNTEFKNIKLSFTAFSPFIPHNSEVSAIPSIGFVFKVKNEDSEDKEISMLFSMENPFAQKTYAIYKNNKLYLHFKAKNNSGTCLVCLNKNAKFQFPTKNVRNTISWLLELSSNFRNNKKFKNVSETKDTSYGAICISEKLGPGEEKEIKFVLSWFFPENLEYNNFKGHIYSKFYKSAFDIAEKFGNDFNNIYKKVLNWTDTIYSGNLPYYIKDLIANSLYFYSKSSLWSKDNKFGVFESFECPSIDNLHLRHHGAVALPFIYPELEAQILKMHAKFQLKSGRLCEEFDPGVGRMIKGMNSEYGRDFADLPSSYVIMVYRYLFLTGDKKFLESIWQNVKNTLYYGAKRDTDNDGLPNKSNGQNTYDFPRWNCGDTMSYTSSLWLASLLSAKKMAEIMKDNKFFSWCDNLFKKAQNSMEKKLFNGEFYALGETNGKRIDACMVDQLLGQWSANLVDLGYILPKEHVRSAIKSILKYNVNDTKYGATSSVFTDGRRDKGDPKGIDTRFAESIWPGTTFAFAVLAIQEGFINDGFSLIKRLYKSFTESINGGLWNMPDITDPDTGKQHHWGFSHYYRNGTIWSALISITGFNYNGFDKELSILPVYSQENLIAPFVTPYCFGIFECSYNKKCLSIKIIVKDGNLEINKFKLINFGIKENSKISLYIDKKTIPVMLNPENEILRIQLNKSINIHKSNNLELNLA